MSVERSMSQKIADAYSAIGEQQIMVGIYQDQAILYAQVQVDTAETIDTIFQFYRGVVLIEPKALSRDGLTWVWCLGVDEDSAAVTLEWFPFIMTTLSAKLRKLDTVRGLIDSEGLCYVDNRWKDANTIQAYAKLLP